MQEEEQRMRGWIAVLGLSVMLTACGINELGEAGAVRRQLPDQVSIAPAVSHVPAVVPVPAPETGSLEWVNNRIVEGWKELEKQHPVRIKGFGIAEGHIMMMVRSAGDVEHKLTEEELAVFKKSLFELSGGEFPLELSVELCCSPEGGMSGRIKQYSEQDNRILLVSETKKNGNTDDPEAAWISLEEDGILLVDGDKVSSGLSKALVGRAATVWTNGLMLTSYPGQTSAPKIVVE
jgi:hypothetical protein